MEPPDVEGPASPHGGIFTRTFLAVLLAVSLSANAVLLVRLHRPALWRRLTSLTAPVPRAAAADHARGEPGARHTVIEYSDFFCPYSAQLHASMKTMPSGSDTRWIYRHFPNARIHPLAPLAAEASECADEQGFFWEYADAVYARQNELNEAVIHEIGWSLPLDIPAFEQCLSAGRRRGTVEEQRLEGLRLRVEGTPTVWIDGVRYDGAVPLTQLEEILPAGGRGTAGTCRD